jgi:hypothetical protein
VHQAKYTKDIVWKLKMEDSKAMTMSMSTTTTLYADEEGEHVDQKEYRSMIGSLLYLTATRPDIQFSVCLCARFQASPRTSHRQEVKQIFQVLASHSRLWPLVLRVLFFGSSWFFGCGFCRVSVGLEVHFWDLPVFGIFFVVLVFPQTVECCSIHYRGRVRCRC